MISNIEFKARVIQSFQGFWRKRHCIASPEGYETLGGYIGDWLRFGSAFEVTKGDFAKFLQAILILIEAYEVDPSILDYEGDPDEAEEIYARPRARRVLHLLAPDDDQTLSLDTYRKWLAYRLSPLCR